MLFELPGIRQKEIVDGECMGLYGKLWMGNAWDCTGNCGWRMHGIVWEIMDGECMGLYGKLWKDAGRIKNGN